MLSRIHKLQWARYLQIPRQQSCLPAGEANHPRIEPVCRLMSTATVKVTPVTDVDDTEEFTLTKDEAISYLENILQIEDPCTFAQNHKYDFLCEVQRRTRMSQPFSRVSLLLNPSDLRCPTMEESKKAMFRKEGGACLQINPFTMAVLRQMGYQANTVNGTISKNRSSAYSTHTGLIVTDVTKKGSVHLLEPGTKLPILEPVSLDFERASPEYQLPGYPIKFFRDSPGIVKLCMPVSKATDVKRDSNLYHDGGKVWRGMITYRTGDFQKWGYCFRVTDAFLKDVTLAPGIHKEIVIFGYSKDSQWTVIKGKTFLQYDKAGTETMKEFKTNPEVIENAHRCFPQYSKETLQRAIGDTE